MNLEIKSEPRIACNCGGECGEVNSAHIDTDKYFRSLLSLILKNSRFKYVIISFIIALVGLIILLVYGDYDYLKFFWIAASLISLVLPAKSAIKNLKKRTLTINTLLVVATISALLLELHEEAVILVIIFSLGEIVEGVMVSMTDRELDMLKSLVPSESHLLNEDGSIKVIETANIKQGNRLIIKTGELVPVDAIVKDGKIDIDKSHLTGESRSETVEIGEMVYAGTKVITGSCTILASVDSGNNQVDFIVRSVDDALKQKSSAEFFSQKFAKIYTPSTFLLALFTALAIPLILSESSTEWVIRALVILVVSCACGLALSVPITMVSAISSAARRGILIRGGVTIEKLSGIKAVIFDKTGTITEGKPSVIDLILLEEEELLPQLLIMSKRSNHPISQSISTYLEKQGVVTSDYSIKEFKETAGMGIYASIGEYKYEMVKDIEYQFRDEIISKYNTAKTYSLIKRDDKVIGYVILEDKVREEAKEVVNILQKQGIYVVMVSGDQQEVCEDVVGKIKINDFKAEVLPLEKVMELRKIKQRYGKVMMIGDGINDTPAFAHADVSIAMGYSGAQVASEVADIVLLKDNIEDIPDILGHGTRAYKIARINLVLAVLTVLALLFLAFLGVLDLISGIFANELTALLIIANGLRLLKFKK